MATPENFDLLNHPLEGANLIEASAGTGKTYAITGLFLRLLMEKGLSVDQILVVTFTEAATEELKDRIRHRLREAIAALLDGGSNDVFLARLIEKCEEPKAALTHLGSALRAFDQAAISTIHGFCGRILHENAFESGSLFDTELIPDQRTIAREVVDDFWRRHFYTASPLFVSYAINNHVHPDRLHALLTQTLVQFRLRIIPQVDIPDSIQEEEAYRATFNELSRMWPTVREAVFDILTTDTGLSRVKYRVKKVADWIGAMDHYLRFGANNPQLFSGFEKFTARVVKESLKKGARPPEHPVFQLCEAHLDNQENLIRLFDQRLLGLKMRLITHAREALDLKKTEKNVLSFDDLLLRVQRALESKGGERLVKAVRAKFRAALLDEFQDTDPVQYAIFKRLFGTKDGVLFLIGDPKQAIYGFRGADIFAYLDASEDVTSRYTLRENWRSEPHLIRAINTVFGGADRPFVFEKIPFHPVAPSPGKDTESLTIDGKSQPPFHLWFAEAGKFTNPDKTIAKGLARQVIPEAVAAEISRLLHLGRNNRARLGKRPLRERDMAVLVRKNSEAGLMQEALSSRHIPSVLYSTGNLFDTPAALEMERVLAAMSEPNNERLFKAALTTEIISLKGEDIARLQEDETHWEQWLVKIRSYHELWREKGFIYMIRQLIREEDLLSRLMSLPDGERRITNILHISEILHTVSAEKRLGMEGLLKWLSEQQDPNTPRLEAHQMRLESDENAVKVVTVHKSKGLEYPIVFCPFAWDGSRLRNRRDAFTFHDQINGNRLTLDLGSDESESHRTFAEDEQLSENLRLLYVALTRAKSRCYLVWGRFNEAETSAPAYLFHQPTPWKGGSPVHAVAEGFIALGDPEVRARLESIKRKAGGSMALHPLPGQTAPDYSPLGREARKLTARTFSVGLDRTWGVSSFSSLVSAGLHSGELADRDAPGPGYDMDQQAEEGRPVGEKHLGIFSFPKGTRAGTFFHDLLEHLDFSSDTGEGLDDMVQRKLMEHGFENHWHETIVRTVRSVLTVPLDLQLPDLNLSRIPNDQRLNELAFYFPLKRISPRTLKGMFREELGFAVSGDFPRKIERLTFFPAMGFMKGFMDLVFRWQDKFYLVDWKSNFLGTRLEDYAQEALRHVMAEEFYILQYLIYTLALDQYLRLRIATYRYEAHFGGVLYIFLRGIDPEKGPDFGIFKDRPSPDLIDRLRAGLVDTDG